MSTETPQSVEERGWPAWWRPMERPERQELFERISSGANGGRDYYVMMVLSAALASLGLLHDSTPVVIGAMLVAPLMGPLLGAGLALVQGNLKLMRSSLSISMIGMALALGLAIGLGLVNPGFEPTMEVEARGTPDIFDLFIALVSGAIAAYAQCRTSLSNTIAGVAIAAALLPPLAVVGIATCMREYVIAVFACILLLTNVVAIIVGAAIVFRAMGVKAGREKDTKRPWVRRSFATLSLLGIALAALLMVEGMDKPRRGQVRPAFYPVSLPVREAVEAYLARHPQIELISLSRHSVEPKAGISALLAAKNDVPEGFRHGLRNAIRGARGVPLIEKLSGFKEVVRIYILEEASRRPIRAELASMARPQ